VKTVQESGNIKSRFKALSLSTVPTKLESITKYASFLNCGLFQTTITEYTVKTIKEEIQGPLKNPGTQWLSEQPNSTSSTVTQAT
jgi:hypothetical protein